MSNLQKTALVIWFNLGWFGCVYLGKWSLHHWSLLIPLIPFLFFLKLKIYSTKQLMFLFIISFVGSAFDSFMFYLGQIKFINYDSAFIPVWLVSMWFLFSTVFYLSHTVFRNKLLLASVLGAIFGPLSYYSGESFQVMAFSGWFAVLAYAIFWGLYFPGLHYFYRKYEWK